MGAIQSTSQQMELMHGVRAQAKLRMALGLPLIAIMVTLLWIVGMPHSEVLWEWLTPIAALHTGYIVAVALLAVHPWSFSAKQLAVATAILDPLFLSVWVAMVDEFGAMLVCFYLFTTLGFGFRLGSRVMWICQTMSLASCAFAMALSPFWRMHPLIGASFLLTLLAVPMYAATLIEQLRSARAHAEQESRAKSELLAKVSHELRTPLSGIVASAELILVEAKDPGLVKRANAIMGLSRSLLLEINDLLDSAKYEANAMELANEPFDLHDVIEQLQMALTNTATAKGIRFAVEADQDIDCYVMGDAHNLGRVLMNLAGNAVKFTERGQVIVRVKLLANESGYYRIHFAVHDTGIGIPRELQQKIFEPFYQVSSGAMRQYGGTGLGLSLARDIVQLMGGDILIESAPEQGSVFYFTVRLHKAARVRRHTTADDAVPVITGQRILVADDNHTNVILLKELLESDHHIVQAVHSGQEAVQALVSHRFDVIILDYNMGDMDGVKVLQLYRFSTVNPAPVFILTADVTQATRARLQQAGAAGVLHKPITRDELRSALQRSVPAGPTPVAVATASTELPPAAAPRDATSVMDLVVQFIDAAALTALQSINRNPEFLVRVYEGFERDVNQNVQALLLSMAANNLTALHESAHALKGVCVGVGANCLAAFAGKLMGLNHVTLIANKDSLKRELQHTSERSLAQFRSMLAMQENQGAGIS